MDKRIAVYSKTMNEEDVFPRHIVTLTIPEALVSRLEAGEILSIARPVTPKRNSEGAIINEIKIPRYEIRMLSGWVYGRKVRAVFCENEDELNV